MFPEGLTDDPRQRRVEGPPGLHLVALSSGGSPADPRNQWAEPGATPNPKDAVEVAANRAICAGRLSLDQAQTAMATDWIALGRQLDAGT
ncbi:MAG: hypothetical protein M3Y91_00880 [Actinomycetota bacterium]|nr:hypothetical protein [Actinomycetota bacterium]